MILIYGIKNSHRGKIVVIFHFLQFQINQELSQFLSIQSDFEESARFFENNEEQQESEIIDFDFVVIKDFVHIESFTSFNAKDSSKSQFVMFTFPQCPLEPLYLTKETKNAIESKIQNVKVERYICCQESHQDNNVHTHILFFLNRNIRMPKRFLSTFYVLQFHPNVLLCKNKLYAINYLTKSPRKLYGSDDFASEFQQLKECQPKELQKNSVAKNKVIFQAISNGNMQQLVQDGVVSLKDYSYIIKGYFSYQRQYVEHVKPMWGQYRGIYIYGASGIGKSTFAKQLSFLISKQIFNDLQAPYSKNQSKWFDGYQGQHVVVLDDYDCGGVLSHHLKIWTDWNSMDEFVEIKGEFVKQNWCAFIITSNYTISEICTNKEGIVDNELYNAISRRCLVLQGIKMTQNHTCEVFCPSRKTYASIIDGQIYERVQSEQAEGKQPKPVTYKEWSEASTK